MFRRTLLSSSIAIAVAMASQPLSAQNRDDDSIIEEVVISGIRASLTKATDIKRDAFQIVDALVAEDIGKFPDNNVVESLQRISGVQVTNRGGGQVSTVAIRGLQDIATTLNGRTIFTASGREVSMQDVPANLLSRAEVYKTRSASQVEGGIAGLIDIQTQRPFDFDGSKVALSGRAIYQEQSEEIDPNISALFSNRWDSGAGEFGALLSLSYTETNYRDQSVTAGAALPYVTADAPAGWDSYGRIFEIDPRVSEQPIWQAGQDAGLPYAAGSTLAFNGMPVEYVLSRDAIFQSDYSGTLERPAANFSFQYAPNDSSEYVFEVFYNGYRNDIYNNLLFTYADAWWALDDELIDSVVLHPGTNVVKERSVRDTGGFTSGDFTTGKTDSYVYALGGDWDITDNFTLAAEVVYQTSEYDETFSAMRLNKTPNFYQVDIDFNSGNGVPAFGFVDNPSTVDVDESDLTNPTDWSIGNVYDTADHREGDAVTFTADGEYFFEQGFFKTFRFGVRYDDHNAAESMRGQSATIAGLSAAEMPELLYVNNGFFDGESDVPQRWLAANGSYLHDNIDDVRATFNMVQGDDFRMFQVFDVNEANTALYVETDFAVELAGRTLDGEIGARYVSIESVFLFGEGEFAGEDSNSHSTLLPSVMLRYSLTDEVMARVSYGETLRQPGFFQLDPTMILTPDPFGIMGTAVSGNAGLKPTESKNIDVSLEWYFAESSSLYATWFERDIEGLVVDLVSVIDVDGGSYRLIRPENASNGKLDGVELGFIYFPENLPELLDGFGVQASYTLLDSTQDTPLVKGQGEIYDTYTSPMFGISDSSYSIVLAYDKDRFDARVSYVWRDDFRSESSARVFANPVDLWRQAEKSLDAQLSYDVTDYLTVTFDATNLTNELFQNYYEDATVFNAGTSLFSRTFALGARVNF